MNPVSETIANLPPLLNSLSELIKILIQNSDDSTKYTIELQLLYENLCLINILGIIIEKEIEFKIKRLAYKSYINKKESSIELEKLNDKILNKLETYKSHGVYYQHKDAIIDLHFKPNKELRICIIGDGSTGKTALANRLCGKPWINEYNPTVEDIFNTTLYFPKGNVELKILDTAGQEEYGALRAFWVNETNFIIYTFSCSDLNTLNLNYARNAAADSRKPIKILLCGTKIDLLDKDNDKLNDLNNTVLKTLKENRFLNIIGCINTSSKINYNIQMLRNLIAYEDSTTTLQKITDKTIILLLSKQEPYITNTTT